MGALLIAELRAANYLPETYVEEMAKPGLDQPNYGLGLWLGSPHVAVRAVAAPRNPYQSPVKSVIRQSAPFLADDVLIFEGVGKTKTWIVPSHSLVIVRFGREPHDWDDSVVPNLLLEALKS